MLRPLLCLLTICLWWATAVSPATADEVRPVSGGWFNTTPTPYPGLLGKRYASGQYIFLDPNDPFLDPIDSSLTGWGVNVNHPLLQSDQGNWLGIDAFVGWNSLGLAGATQTPPPFPIGLQLDLDLSSTSVGATFYADPLQPVRPLVQIGASFSRASTLILVDGFGGTLVDTQTDLLLTAGVEFDLNDWLAGRTVFDLETEDSFSDSTFRGDLIAWPAETIFLRCGVIAPLSGDAIGGTIGVGVTF